MMSVQERIRHRRRSGPSVRLHKRHRTAIAVAPPPDTEAAIIAFAARTYPCAGIQLEAAARLATRLGWAAARALQGDRP